MGSPRRVWNQPGSFLLSSVSGPRGTDRPPGAVSVCGLDALSAHCGSGSGPGTGAVMVSRETHPLTSGACSLVGKTGAREGVQQVAQTTWGIVEVCLGEAT